VSGVRRGEADVTQIPDRVPTEAEVPSESMPGLDPAEDLAGDSGPDQWSASVHELVERHGDKPDLRAGEVIAELLDSHPEYLDKRIVPGAIGDVGPARSAAEHAAVASARWDGAMSPLLTGRRVIIALTMDAGVGWPLLQAGVIASLVEQWRPKARTGLEPDLVVWDLLSDAGRALADEQPLLAAALGAPAEWSVSSPAEVSALVWAPSGDRVAFLADGVVYEAARGGAARRVGAPGGRVLSLGWGIGGVVALCLHDGTAELVRATDETPLGELDSVSDGVLSGDGASGWLLVDDTLLRWVPAGQPPTKVLGPGAVPVAVNRAGSHALVEWEQKSMVLVDGLEGRLPSGPTGPNSSWLSGGAQEVQAGERKDRPCTLVTVGRRLAVAAANSAGGVMVEHQPFPPVAWIATGPEPATALASDPAGTTLAVASGHRIEVWPLTRARPSVREVPGYDSDRVGQDDAWSASAPMRDLLDADRDARALAALIASTQLKAPMAIGLFGAWGSGKSFVLGLIRHMLTEITTTGHDEGYLDDVRVVRFNAWQYAEVNLWASLVDEVLTEIGPVPPAQEPEHVQQAEEAAREAENRAQAKASEVAKAEDARRRLTRVRRLTWAAAAVAAVIATGIIAVAVLGAPARLAAGYGAAVALLTFASAAATQVKRVAAQGRELKEAGQDVSAATTWVARQMGSSAVDSARQKVLSSRYDYELALQEAGRLRQEASRVRELSVSPQLGSVLQRMSALTEYRDQLSLVARTRDRFEEIDKAVTAARIRRAEHPEQALPEGDPGFERVVVMIDDLDRCAPEKVVTVLEAVHLLFDFEMFVVVIAVDTRWLDQSLRIRYRQLLGEAGAVPSDYLEKIIQIPLHLTPLNEDMVRRMISGLTGTRETETQPTRAPSRKPGDAALEPNPLAGAALRRIATKLRPPRAPLPAEVLQITQDEATTMSAVAPLVGSTPRTVKRYVNTYRLLKARSPNPAVFDEPIDGIADHEIVAFLLAVVTGHPALAAVLLPALAAPPPGANLNTLITALDTRDGRQELASSQAQVTTWLVTHPGHARAAASRFAEWAAEIARYSFTPATTPDT